MISWQADPANMCIDVAKWSKAAIQKGMGSNPTIANCSCSEQPFTAAQGVKMYNQAPQTECMHHSMLLFGMPKVQVCSLSVHAWKQTVSQLACMTHKEFPRLAQVMA